MKAPDLWHSRAIRSNDHLHWNAYRSFRQEAKHELRFAEKAHVRTELLNSKGNTNAIWKIINNCLPRKSCNRPFQTENSTALVNNFNEYFTTVWSVTAQKALDLAIEHNFDIHPTISPAVSAVEPSLDQCTGAFQFHMVLDKDVERVIKSFSLNKAPGYDRVSARVLKDSLPVILPSITSIMNNSFHTGTFARAWKIAEVTPIPKSGNPEDPCNNRPISLLPILSKVSERLAHGQFVDYLTASKKLAKTQSGNRKLHSTETALLCVTDDLLQAIDDKKISALVLLDMSKAFDSIRHDILFQKLQALGVSSLSLDWFHSYLVGRSQRVRIHDAISDALVLKYGVPQGSILGPVLFTIYVNDLLSVPTHCKSACYVDDSKLYLSFPSSDISTAIDNLNADLESVSRWCCKNSLLINPDKTKVLIIGVPQLLNKFPTVSVRMLGKETTSLLM